MAELYVKLDTNYPDDPKVIEAGEKAELLYIRSLCLAKRILSDGFVADAQLPRFGLSGVSSRARRLVDVGLWARDTERGGYWITAWAKRNRSADDVRAQLEAASAAGTLGNHRRWHAGRPVPDCPHCEPESPTRSGTPIAPDRLPSDTRSPETETETETPPPAREAIANGDQPADPPGQGGTATPPTPDDAAGQALDAIVTAAPPEHADTLRRGRRSKAILDRLAELAADGWKPSELAHRVSQLGWRVEHADGAVLHRLRAIDGPPPNRVAAEQRTAEQQEAEQRDADAAAKQQRRAELDAAIDAMPADEQAQLATKAAAACPFPREPDLAVPAVRGMARSIIAERLEPADGGTR